QTEQHDVIVVMPDGGAGSFYSNANFPLPGREAAWESFIMDQVLPFVHANFRTDRSRMAIAGLSMGGWGALALGQRYYGHFRSISSYSGPADCNPATLDGAAVAGAIWACPGFDAVKYWPPATCPAPPGARISTPRSPRATTRSTTWAPTGTSGCSCAPGTGPGSTSSTGSRTIPTSGRRCRPSSSRSGPTSSRTR